MAERVGRRMQTQHIQEVNKCRGHVACQATPLTSIRQSRAPGAQRRVTPAWLDEGQAQMCARLVSRDCYAVDWRWALGTLGRCHYVLTSGRSCQEEQIGGEQHVALAAAVRVLPGPKR